MAEEEKIIVNRITTGETTIITISRVRSYQWCGRMSVFSWNIRPEILIITTPSGRKAFHINGEEITLEQLVRKFPDIPLKLEETQANLILRNRTNLQSQTDTSVAPIKNIRDNTHIQ